MIDHTRPLFSVIAQTEPAIGATARPARTRRRSSGESDSVERPRSDWGELFAVPGWILAALAVAAPALGGATALWAQAALALATGLLFLWKPPTRSLGPVFNIATGLFLIIAATAFLPAQWWSGEDWRTRLQALPGLELPSTRSPQPWLSFEACGVLLLAVGWAYYLLTYTWDRKTAPKALAVFNGSLVGLALLALLAYLSGFKPPFWPVTENSIANFGFFPNRNQTANVLALAGIMVNALAFEDLRKRRKICLFWFATLGLICAALIVAYSRSGIILFFGGVAIWALCSMRLSASTQTTALTVSGTTLLLALLFVFGGDTLARFQTEPVALLENFRILVQKDAWKLALEAPWLGHGLANFEPLFAMAREHSTMSNRAVHPESDWMWTAVEMGWPAVLLLLIGFGLWLKKCFPLDQGTAPLIRSAALVAALGFFCHGFVDVSGHRLGSLWPALFLMSIAMHPKCVRQASAWVSPVFRVLGVVLIALGAWWMASFFAPLPTLVNYQRLAAKADAAMVENQPDTVIAATTAALRMAPLDWDLYHGRARAQAVKGFLSKASTDFALARILEPNWSDFCLDEGLLWLDLEQPERAVDAWREALDRGASAVPELYRQMLLATKTRFEMREVLREWARKKRAFLLLFLETAAPLEFELERDGLLVEDPKLASFSPLERTRFLHLWYERLGVTGVGEFLLAHPEWHAENYLLLARYYAAQEDFKKAYLTVKPHAPAASIPRFETSTSLPELERAFYLGSKDLVAGLALLGAQMKHGKLEDAAGTMKVLREDKARPRYLYALDCELQAQRKDWQKAWNAWLAYETTSG